jgi:hypothetical protein
MGRRRKRRPWLRRRGVAVASVEQEDEDANCLGED